MRSKAVVAAVAAILWAGITSCATSRATDRVAVTSTTALAPHIDLNESGVLEALRQSNPAHYEKLAKASPWIAVDEVLGAHL